MPVTRGARGAREKASESLPTELAGDDTNRPVASTSRAKLDDHDEDIEAGHLRRLD